MVLVKLRSMLGARRNRRLALALVGGLLGGCEPDVSPRPQDVAEHGRPLPLEEGANDSSISASSPLRPSEDDSSELTEIAGLHRKAAEITVLAHFEVMKVIRPGLREGDLKRTIDQVFAANGASGVCFPHIVGSGPNSTIPHYDGDQRILEEGDVVVVDIGASYAGWCADIARTYPVGGRFTARQREIYRLVLDAQGAAAAHVVPGQTSMRDLDALVRRHFQQSPLRARDRSGLLQTMDSFFQHYVGHYLAREVHPPADYSSPIPLDQVFVIEPGIYVESEGIGVRIEDDYVLTEQGPLRLSGSLPSTPEAIERTILGGR